MLAAKNATSVLFRKSLAPLIADVTAFTSPPPFSGVPDG
jgi:hypothetical protein